VEAQQEPFLEGFLIKDSLFSDEKEFCSYLELQNNVNSQFSLSVFCVSKKL